MKNLFISVNGSVPNDTLHGYFRSCAISVKSTNPKVDMKCVIWDCKVKSTEITEKTKIKGAVCVF